MNDWRIRPARPEDAAALADCIDDAYAVHRARIADLPRVSEGLPQDIATNLVWVVERAGSIIGGLVLIAADNHMVLANVAVSPREAGAGLGRALLDLAERETVRRGLSVLRLTTHAGMPENIRLYRHLGWHETMREGNRVRMAKIL